MRGRTALVTGASRGIGAAIAGRFARDGAKVLAPGRAELDLGSDASVDAFLKRLAEPVDILVNNAGINPPGSAADVRDADLRETLQVNLASPLRLARGLIPGMSARRYGRIVNISSIWGLVTRPGRVAYTMSKSGIHGLTRAMAVELAPAGILVNTLAPGYVNTEMTRRNNSDEALADIRRNIPLGRLAEPEEIAEVAAFLCSGRNACMTGQAIVVDGGYSCL